MWHSPNLPLWEGLLRITAQVSYLDFIISKIAVLFQGLTFFFFFFAAKRLLGPQRRICIKGKDPPNDVIRHTRNAYGVSRGGFGVGSLSHAGASHEMSQSESGSQCTSVPVLEFVTDWFYMFYRLWF